MYDTRHFITTTSSDTTTHYYLCKIAVAVAEEGEAAAPDLYVYVRGRVAWVCATLLHDCYCYC